MKSIKHRITDEVLFTYDDVIRPSDVIDVDLNLADFSDAVFNDGKFLNFKAPTSNFDRAKFNGSIFDDSTFEVSSFKESTFNRSKFNGSTFDKSIFYESTFDKSIFEDSTFEDSTFDKSSFEDSKFNGSIFNYSTFNDSIFNGSTFNDSTFNDSIFNYSTFNDSIFDSSNFYNSRFDYSQLKYIIPYLKTKIPIIKNIHQKIYGVCSVESSFDMGSWHSLCGTTHCEAGHLTLLAGKLGKQLENEVGTALAAMIIYHENSNLPIEWDYFIKSNENALERMKKYAEIEGE